MKQENATCKGRGGKCIIIILLIINIILSALAFCYAYKNYNLEIIRGGGKENFEKMTEFYKSPAFVEYVTIAQQEQIAAFDASNPSEQNPEIGNETETPTIQNQTLDQQTIEALKQTGHIKGDENAEITILEFADANCSFCKRQIAQSKTIQTIMDAYPNVNMMYKNMPVLGSFEQAQAMECFGATSSVEDYYTFVEEVYGTNNTNLDNLLDIAESLWGNKEEIRTCVTEGNFEALVNTQMQEGQSFKIQGTPASVIINNNNGEWKLIEGAYPAEEFETIINELLNK